MTSLSGTATAPLPIPFSLNLCGTLRGRRLEKELAPKPSDERARQLAAKRKIQHEVQMLSLEWSKILLQRQIDDAINPATDPRLRRDLCNDVLNRGVGRPKEQEDENADAKKKGNSGAQEFLEMLAAISTAASAAAVLNHNIASTPRIERDIGGSGTDENSLQSFLDGLENDLDGEEVDDEQ